MNETSWLTQMILLHWQEHRPQMVEELRQQNLLEQAIEDAEKRTSDLLYDLISVQKLPYQDAWEIATREWAFLPAEDIEPPFSAPASLTFPKKGPTETSE